MGKRYQQMAVWKSKNNLRRTKCILVAGNYVEKRQNHYDLPILGLPASLYELFERSS